MSLRHVLRGLRWLVLAGVPATFGWACNNLLNIDEGRLACVHTSECPGNEVCLYERCSPECEGDRDCPDGEDCTQTDFGAHCVRNSVLQCEGDDDCDGGATCDPEAGCRYPCSSSSQCVDGQRCEGGHCVGKSTGGSGVGGSAGGGAGGEGGADSITSGSVGGTGGSGGTAQESCEDGKLRCPLQAAAEREVCKNGSWEPTSACESGTVCDRQSDGKCVELVDECLGKTAGAAYCNGSTRLVCSDDLASVTSESCDSAAHCNQATGPQCAACLEDEYTCDADVLKRCNDDHTDYTEVATCSDAPCNALLGECTERVCDAGAYYCDAASNTLSHCNEDGTGFEADPVDCGTGICDAENGQCDQCQAGTVLGCFDGETQQVCDDEGQGVVTVACADVDGDTPICVGEGNCVECEPLSATCLDVHQIQRCSAEGKLEAVKTCVDQACVDDSCVGECSPGNTDCDDDSHVKTCEDDGTYGDPVSCSGQACVGASCTGQCEPMAKQCADKFSRQECTSAGSWDNAVTCTGQACVNGSCVGVCVPETKRCNNGKVETCSDSGTWGNPQTCTDQTCVESGTTASCQGVCAPDYQRCSNNNVQNCNASGAYSGTAANCTTAGQTCVTSGTTAMCQGTCAPGDQRCSSNNVQNCNASGSYSGTAANCTTAGQTCVASGDTAMCQGTCAPGYQRCNNNNVQNCNASGSYSGTASNCTTANKTCMPSGTTASCGGECAPDATTCIDNDAYHCVNGSYSILQNCSPPGEICSSGECVANDPYEIGFASALANSATLADNILYLQKLPTITVDADLQQLGMYGRGDNGAYAQFALYEDSGGLPGARVAVTGDVLVNVGLTEDAPMPASITLRAGRTYWVGGVFYGGAQLYSNANSSAPDVQRAALTYGYPFPTTFTPGNPLTDIEFSFYIRVRTVSE